MDKKLNVNWYPGHMVKARREIEDKLKLIDIVIEVLDARAPSATQNHDFDSLFGTKKRMYILNKSDMADDTITKQWIEHYREKGIHAVSFSAISASYDFIFSPQSVIISFCCAICLRLNCKRCNHRFYTGRSISFVRTERLWKNDIAQYHWRIGSL